MTAPSTENAYITSGGVKEAIAITNLTAMVEASLVHFLAETHLGSSWVDVW